MVICSFVTDSVSGVHAYVGRYYGQAAPGCGIQDNMPLGGRDTFTYEDKTYSIFVLSSGVSLWYNKEIFTQNGLTHMMNF
ncbi:hypothetical protein YSY43_37290 [Paenibacillus sp. YSY-4.3]